MIIMAAQVAEVVVEVIATVESRIVLTILIFHRYLSDKILQALMIYDEEDIYLDDNGYEYGENCRFIFMLF